MISLDAIALSQETHTLTPISELGKEHGLNSSKIRLLTRYFGLSSVALNNSTHTAMCADPLTAIVSKFTELSNCKGLLIYAKTQTHNTHIDTHWLSKIANNAGLSAWEILTISMNHCTSALSVFELISSMKESKPIIILTGEKCFHSSTCHQSDAVLGEMPVAVLLNHEKGDLQIVNTRLKHKPRYYMNPVKMPTKLRREFNKNFSIYLDEFISESLEAFNLSSNSIDLVVPYNLNIPLLSKIAETYNWQDCIYTKTAAHVGHLFCSDVFYNLANVLPQTKAKRIFCFAAGMGASFSAFILERSLRS